MGAFEAFYESALQHPVLLWAAAGAAGAWALTRRELSPSLRHYLRALLLLSLLDAWLTARHVYGLGELGGAAKSAVPLFFVLAGDARYLLLLGAATRDGGVVFRRRGVLAGLGLTLVVPLLSQLVMTALPDAWSSPRVLYLVYELAFAALVLSLLRWHPAVREQPWLAAVSRFVLVYYALWASADAILLATGSDLGFALRVVPNVLYYGGLLAAIARAGVAARRSA